MSLIDLLAWHSCSKEIHQLASIILRGVVEIQAFIVLFDVQCVGVNVVFENHLLQVVEGFLVRCLRIKGNQIGEKIRCF